MFCIALVEWLVASSDVEFVERAEALFFGGNPDSPPGILNVLPGWSCRRYSQAVESRQTASKLCGDLAWGGVNRLSMTVTSGVHTAQLADDFTGSLILARRAAWFLRNRGYFPESGQRRGDTIVSGGAGKVDRCLSGTPLAVEVDEVVGGGVVRGDGLFAAQLR